MWKWTVIVVSGICTFASLYMVLLASGSSVYLLTGFAVLFGIPFILSLKRFASGEDMADGEFPEGQKTPSFVPHWFVMGGLIIAGIAILAAIIFPMLKS